jgi:spore coat protein SA
MVDLPTAKAPPGSRLSVAVLLSGREQFSFYYGGALARWTYEVYSRLQSSVDVTVFGFPTDPKTIYTLPHKSSGWWRACVLASRIPGIRRVEDELWLRPLMARLRQFQVIHIHNRPQWVDTLRRLGYRGSIVLHLQNDHLGHWNADMLDALAPKLQALVVCSTYLAERSSLKSRKLSAKTKLVFNGVNTQIFHPREELREPKTIFFVGSFIPQKGVLQLVKAYARVLEKHPDAKLVIGGSASFGVERETPYIRQVRQLADTILREKGARIQFAGYLHHDNELPSWFQKATIFTSPSLFQEPFGLVNAEAMASATPVVGTNRGGVPEVLADSGKVINPEDVGEYASGLSELLADPARCARMGRAGRERSQEIFDWDVTAKHWLQLLQDLS